MLQKSRDQMKRTGTSLLVILFLALLIVPELKAQDAHWSQFAANPLRLSPSMAGVYEGDWRAGINYREQWASVIGPNPYRSIHASFDKRFFAIKNDYFAVGVNFMNDQAGTGGYTTNEGHVTISYLKQMAGSRLSGMAQYLVVGIQGGVGQRSVDWDQLSFSNQYDNFVNQYNPALPSNEPIGVSSRIFPDINAGLMWYGVFDDRKSIYVGMAAHHLNRPDVSFFQERSDYLHSRYSIYAGAEYPMGDYFSIMPSGVVMFQNVEFETALGLNIRYRNNDWKDVALRAGAWGRIVGKERGLGTDAIVAMAGIEFQRVTLGVTFDVNTSTLIAATNRRGAFELSLYYTHPGRTRGELKCPKF